MTFLESLTVGVRAYETERNRSALRKLTSGFCSPRWNLFQKQWVRPSHGTYGFSFFCGQADGDSRNLLRYDFECCRILHQSPALTFDEQAMCQTMPQACLAA